MKFVRSLTPLSRAIGLAILAALLIWAFVFVRDLFVGTAEVEADLATNQADAAIESGKDAVDGVSRQAENEAERDRSLGDMKDKVDEADSVADAHDVGAGWLCDQFGICAGN